VGTGTLLAEPKRQTQGCRSGNLTWLLHMAPPRERASPCPCSVKQPSQPPVSSGLAPLRRGNYRSAIRHHRDLQEKIVMDLEASLEAVSHVLQRASLATAPQPVQAPEPAPYDAEQVRWSDVALSHRHPCVAAVGHGGAPANVIWHDRDPLPLGPHHPPWRQPSRGDRIHCCIPCVPERGRSSAGRSRVLMLLLQL
jgi:hypothetical protein